MAKIPKFITKKAKDAVDLALFDCDILRYEIGAVCLDHPFVKGARIPAPASFIKDLVLSRIEGVMDAVGADDCIMYFTGAGNFRFDIATIQPYKGNRSDLSKPYHWKTVDFIIREAFEGKIVDITGTEADDALGLKQGELLLEGRTTSAICSRDKDLRMREGWHYSWGCGQNQPEKPLYFINYLEGMKFFFQQMLTGDSTDHILGCGRRELKVYKSGEKEGQEYTRRVGVGPKKAVSLLDEGTSIQEWYNIVKAEYEAIYEEDHERIMLENSRLLFIGQAGKDNMFDWSWLEIEESGDVEQREGSERQREVPNIQVEPPRSVDT